MLYIQFNNYVSQIVSFSTLWVFYTEHKVAILSILGGLLLIFSTITGLLRYNRKKRNKKEYVVRPVTALIGSDQQRIEALNNELMPFGFSYDPQQDFFYSNMNGWQRSFGYCRLYDESSPLLSMIIDCEPITFNYNGRKWLIEFWKGQYGMTTGGEVGIYYTTGPDLNILGVFNGTFYTAVNDEDMINMSFAFRKNGNLIFTRSAYHWWITGFKLAEFSQPSELSMDIIMDLYDNQMAMAFIEALMKVGYTEKEFAVRGRRVFIHFAKPHSPQPYTRTALTVYLAQRNNRRLCNSFNEITASYTDTIDKLDIVKNVSPEMYDKILNMGKPIKVFDSYDKIKSYVGRQ